MDPPGVHAPPCQRPPPASGRGTNLNTAAAAFQRELPHTYQHSRSACPEPAIVDSFHKPLPLPTGGYPRQANALPAPP